MRTSTILVVLAGAVSLVAPPDTSATSARPASQTTRTFLGPGADARVFTMRQPRGVVLLTRLTVTRGISAWADARIPGVAGVRVSTSDCRRRGRFDVCTQFQEWCPMPRAAWRIHLRKTGGPEGVIRFDFVVGAPRRS